MYPEMKIRFKSIEWGKLANYWVFGVLVGAMVFFIGGVVTNSWLASIERSHDTLEIRTENMEWDEPKIREMINLIESFDSEVTQIIWKRFGSGKNINVKFRNWLNVEKQDDNT